MSTARDELIDMSAENIVTYFITIDDPQRKTHKRSVEAILRKYWPQQVVQLRTPAVVVAEAPTEQIVNNNPLPVVLEPTIEPTNGRVVPHVRGDVVARSMGKKAHINVGQTYIVAMNSNRILGAAGAALDRTGHTGVSFEAKLIARHTDAVGREILVFDNGVRIVDEMEQFRFQRSGAGTTIA